MKKKTKIILWISGILAGILLLLIGSACFLAAKIMDPEPQFSKSRVNMLAALTSTAKIQKAVRNAGKTKQNQTLFLTDSEFNAQAHSLSMLKNTGLRNLQLTLNHGIFTFCGTKEIASTPFGKYIHFRADFLFEIQEGILKIQLKKVYAGTLELPLSLCEKELKKQLDMHFYGTLREKILKNSGISCSANDRGILLTLPPNVVKKLLPVLEVRP